MADDAPELAAWRALWQRFAALGEELYGPGYPGAPADRVEGLAHLTEQVVCWLDVGGGPRRPGPADVPAPERPLHQWGGPNADNVYRHARVEPGRRYRITGRMHSCDDFILAIRAGFMHMERWGHARARSPRRSSASVPATTSSCCSAVPVSRVGSRCPRAR